MKEGSKLLAGLGLIFIGTSKLILIDIPREIERRKHRHIDQVDKKTIDVNDLNSDGLADIVVEQNSGDKTIYYNTESGYLTAEQMKQREIQRIEQSYQEQLRQTNESYKRAYDGNNVGGAE